MRVLCIITKYLFPALMQSSYALLPATSHPKTIGGMCYAIIGSSHQYAMPKSRFTSIGLKAPNHHQPIRDWDTKQHGLQTSYPSMQSPNCRPGKLDMLSQHAMYIQAIPACYWPIESQGSHSHYPSMQ